MVPRKPRHLAFVSFIWLALVGAAFLTVLVANWNDNAYIDLALIGVALVISSIPFGIAAFLNHSTVYRLAVPFGKGLIWIISALGLFILIQSLIIIPSQSYPTNRVFISHLLGLVLLIPTTFFVGYRFKN